MIHSLPKRCCHCGRSVDRGSDREVTHALLVCTALDIGETERDVACVLDIVSLQPADRNRDELP